MSESCTKLFVLSLHRTVIGSSCLQANIASPITVYIKATEEREEQAWNLQSFQVAPLGPPSAMCLRRRSTHGTAWEKEDLSCDKNPKLHERIRRPATQLLDVLIGYAIIFRMLGSASSEAVATVVARSNTCCLKTALQDLDKSISWKSTSIEAEKRCGGWSWISSYEA